MALFGLTDRLGEVAKAIDTATKAVGKAVAKTAAGPVKVVDKTVGQIRKPVTASEAKANARREQTDSDL